MNDERIKYVSEAWEIVSAGAESVSMSELAAKFRPAEHPRATSREKTAAQVEQEFAAGIESYFKDG